MARQSLGLVMILRDEAANLHRSLEPIAHLFDEVVVADTGSQDATPDICRRLGAEVHPHEWDHDFAQARNFAITKAKSDWLLWLDGDNALSGQGVDALRQRLTPEPAIIWAQEVVEPGGQRLWQKRCFPRLPGVGFAGRVHEQLVHPAHWPQVAAPVEITHWGYADPAQVEAKGRYYKTLLQEDLAANPEDFYARFQLARCHLNLRETPQAMAQLEHMLRGDKARRANPQLWAHAVQMLSALLQRQGQGDRARSLLKSVLVHMPSHGLTHYHLGRLAYSQGDHALAVRHLAQSIRLGLGQPMVDMDPVRTGFLARYFLAKALKNLGDIARALEEMTRAAQERGATSAARTELAQWLMELGRLDQARAELEQTLQSNPGDRRARQLWAQVGAAA